MKVTLTKTIEVSEERQIELSNVDLFFDDKGITATVELEGADPDDYASMLVPWEDLLNSAMASSQEDPDSANICKRLRELADKLEAWSTAT